MLPKLNNFSFETDSDGVAIVRLTVADRRTNTITRSVIRDLAELATHIREDASIQGVVLTSGRAHVFCAGADLVEMTENLTSWKNASTTGELMAALDECAQLGRQLRALELCGKTVVAAINGVALGGGLEILLACHRRIAICSPAITFSFPETGVGLLPGAGGTQRLIRLLGIDRALPYLMDGTTLSASDALEMGLLSEVVPAEELMARAKVLALDRSACVAPWDRPGFSLSGSGIYGSINSYNAFSISNARLRKRYFGNYPAQENVIKAVYEGSLVGMDCGLRIENRYFLNTVRTPQATAMLRSLFWSKQELSKGRARPGGFSKFTVYRSAVLGAGMMGAGIAYENACAGIETTLVDVDRTSADRGKAHVAELCRRAVRSGRMSQDTAVGALALIRPTDDYADIDDVDIVIEAVFESRELKASVTRLAEPHINAGGIFATNTSTLPIEGLAAAAQHPGSFIGVHFFSPVDRMPLVEIIVGPRTTQESVAKAIDYVLALGKTPIVVQDRRGFYTSRTFNTYVSEGLAMLTEGIHPAIVDNIGRMTSMPRGPLELADDVGLDLLNDVARQTAEDLDVEFPRQPEHKLIAELVALGRKGRKSTHGIYEYESAGGTKSLWTGLQKMFPVRVAQVDAAQARDIRDRLLYRQAIEAARCIYEGVLSDPRHADVGALLGWGFASWTGGPLSFIDMVGPSAFVSRANELAAKHGERFAPPPNLTTMAATNLTFYEN